MDLSGVLKFLQGVRSLLGMASNQFPLTVSDSMKEKVTTLITTPGAQIRMVTVTTANRELTPEVREPITDILRELNDLEDVEPFACHEHYDQALVFKSITERSRPTVDISMQIREWGQTTEPQRMYYGQVSAAEVADWYQEHGMDLFAENIRVVIPRSEINDGILESVISSPDQFFYFNNGITILADSITTGPGGRLSKDVGFFQLSKASIVNGAQTVSVLGSALDGPHHENLGNAYVMVRCIEVPDEDADTGRLITRYTNTQNDVSSQDFAFLDPEQHRLAEELQVLGFTYMLRSAEATTSKNGKTISLREAAVALACASENITHAVTAKREVSRLFTDSYQILFNPETDPLLLQRAVQITAKVDEILRKIAASSEGIRNGVAVHGGRIIAHLAIKSLGRQFLSNPQSDFEASFANLDEYIEETVERMVANFPERTYPGNIFKNTNRVKQLIDDASL